MSRHHREGLDSGFYIKGITEQASAPKTNDIVEVAKHPLVKPALVLAGAICAAVAFDKANGAETAPQPDEVAISVPTLDR